MSPVEVSATAENRIKGKFKYPERFYQTDNGIVAKVYKPVSKDMER